MSKNIFPKHGKIIIIDNKREEVKLVEQLLTKNGIPYIYYDFDELMSFKDEIKKVDGIRLVFLDIRLQDGNEGETNINSVLANTIESVIGVENGPYTIVLWTNEFHLKDKVETYLLNNLKDDETTKPTYVCALDKKDFNEDQTTLFNEVSKELDKNKPLEFLTALETLTMEVPSNLLNMILQVAKNGQDANYINKLLMLLASVESKEDLDSVKATKNILTVISYLVKDRYMHLVSDDDYIKKVSNFFEIIHDQKSLDISVEVKAKINSAFNLNTYGNETDKMPGKVYKINGIEDLVAFEKSTFGKDKPDSVKKNNKTANIHPELIKVDITPYCDYAQDKAHVSTYVYGYLIYIDKVNEKNENQKWYDLDYSKLSNKPSVYSTPCFINNDKLFILLINTKWIKYEEYKVDKDNYLFRLNEALTCDIRKTAADNLARVGIPSV